MNKLHKIYLIFFSMSFILTGQSLYAEERLLITDVYIPFEPSKISLISKFDDGSVITTQGSSKQIGSSMLKENYVLGAALDIPDTVKKLDILFIAHGSEDQVKGLSISKMNVSDLIPIQGAEQYYRDSIVSLKTKIETVEAEDVSIRKSVEDLKREVSDDEGLKKLTKAQEKFRRIEGQKAALERQVRHLQFLSTEAQSQELPYNFTKRELELTSQLSELASAAKLTETKEVDDANLGEEDMQEMLSVVESAQGYSVEELEARLRGLQQRVQAQ